MNKALEDDGFLYDALRTEVANHEYRWTGDPSNALEALCLENNADDERIQRILKKAIIDYSNNLIL